VNIENIIYEMLTENTGIHMLDSGGKDGRNWQINQKRTLKDFQNDKYISYKDDYPEKSLFHHLTESCEYLPNVNKKLTDWINKDKYHYMDNSEGRENSWHDVEHFMQKFIYPESKINCIYTYNDETVLSQDIQFLYADDFYDNNIIALSIHNGADVRGGLTDYKFFKVDWDMFLNYSLDYYNDEDIREMYQDKSA
tara:strand:- start:15 stop:599 length:585 start_codon:yes stop_codon:yes gene_type:complete